MQETRYKHVILLEAEQIGSREMFWQEPKKNVVILNRAQGYTIGLIFPVEEFRILQWKEYRWQY